MPRLCQTLGAALSAEVDRMRAEVERQTGLAMLAKLDEAAARKAIDATKLSLRAANTARFAALHGPIQARPPCRGHNTQYDARRPRRSVARAMQRAPKRRSPSAASSASPNSRPSVRPPAAQPSALVWRGARPMQADTPGRLTGGSG
jgi:hypothetical protein